MRVGHAAHHVSHHLDKANKGLGKANEIGQKATDALTNVGDLVDTGKSLFQGAKHVFSKITGDTVQHGEAKPKAHLMAEHEAHQLAAEQHGETGDADPIALAMQKLAEAIHGSHGDG